MESQNTSFGKKIKSLGKIFFKIFNKKEKKKENADSTNQNE